LADLLAHAFSEANIPSLPDDERLAGQNPETDYLQRAALVSGSLLAAGILRSTRFRFWWQLAAIAFSKSQLLYDYLTTLGVGEHFFAFRYEVRAQLLP
jgi:hypothetical protein